MSRINTIICLRRPASIDIWRAFYHILIENSLPFPAGGGDDVTEASSSLVLWISALRKREEQVRSVGSSPDCGRSTQSSPFSIIYCSVFTFRVICVCNVLIIRPQ